MHTSLWARALGGTLLALAIPMSLPAQAAVAPNGTIAISALDDVGTERIFTLQPDGTGLTNITASHAGSQSNPVWSPDSTRILYGSSEAGGVFTTDDVWVMNADGSGATLVTPDDDLGLNPFDMSPSWSPDGTQFVWNTNREGDEDIYVANIDGSNARPLIVDELTLTNEFGTFYGIERFPAWSPDGTRVAFYESLTSNNLALIDASGTGPITNVVVPFGELASGFSDISWSPDGSSLLYLEATAGNSQPLLAVSNVDTGEVFSWDLVADGYADLATPVYSPDGTQITFSAYSFATGEYVVLSIPSPTVTPLAAGRMAAAADLPGVTVLPGTAGALSHDWAAIGAAPMCTITGTERNDRLVGTTGDDVICGLGGNDTIQGRGGNDTILGGAGNDTVDAGPGDDVVRGDIGNDILRGSRGNDRLNGGAGRDQVTGGEGSDRMFGEEGIDRLLGADHVRDNDTLEGGAARDVCTADNSDTSTNC